jgi:hypothetical protein
MAPPLAPYRLYLSLTKLKGTSMWNLCDGATMAKALQGSVLEPLSP